MREILFRGKTESGEWVTGTLDNIDEPYRIGARNGSVKFETVITDTVGQYTGLEDKNGVKIFEGDILEIAIFRIYEDHRRMTAAIWRTAVEYFYGAFTIKDTGETYPLSEYIYPGGTCAYQSEFEVMGNIYDNPELLGR